MRFGGLQLTRLVRRGRGFYVDGEPWGSENLNLGRTSFMDAPLREKLIFETPRGWYQIVDEIKILIKSKIRVHQKFEYIKNFSKSNIRVNQKFEQIRNSSNSKNLTESKIWIGQKVN